MPKFFGDVDRKRDGSVGSSYPAWYFDQHREELQESMMQKKRAIENGMIPQGSIPETIAEMQKEEKRLREIEDSRPKSKPSDIDEVAKVRKELGDEISNTLFSRSDMKKGLASPHEEARRMTRPCIKVTSDGMARACKDCNVTIHDGMITRNEAAKVWKIMGKYLGEYTNVERLRKD